MSTVSATRQFVPRCAAAFVLALFALVAGCAPQTPDSESGQAERPVEEADENANDDPPAAEPERAADDQPAPEPAADESDSASEKEPTRAEIRAAAMDPTVELPEQVSESLRSVEYDPIPESTTRGVHYWVSNENFHELYRPYVDDHGGIYLGVGTDQNYMIGAWARSPILIMMDFDEEIRNLHHIYGSVFRRAETTKAHMRAWEQPDKLRAWLAEDFEGARRAKLEATLEDARFYVLARLRKIVKHSEERDVATFMTDQAQYDFVRQLWMNGRVIAVRGDLTADKTMVQIADALEEYGLTLGLMYVSNAEQYFDFTPQYRRNIIAQPFGEDSLILRTRPYKGLGVPEEGEYHYNVQPGQHFSELLEESRTKNVLRMLKRYRTNHPEREGVSMIDKPVAPSETPPEVAEGG